MDVQKLQLYSTFPYGAKSVYMLRQKYLIDCKWLKHVVYTLSGTMSRPTCDSLSSIFSFKIYFEMSSADATQLTKCGTIPRFRHSCMTLVFHVISEHTRKAEV